MKPSILGALIGALAGFIVVLVQYLAVIQSGVLNALLFPGHIFIRYANTTGLGDFGLMIFDFLAYFSNLVLYAAIGFAVGLLFGRRRPSRNGEPVQQSDR